MVRRDDKLKAELRKYFGFKNIRGWFGYALLRRQGLSTEAIWREAERDYMSRVGHFENNVSAVRRIQRAFRARPLRPSDVVKWTSRHGDVFTDYHFPVSETDDDGMFSEVVRAVGSVPKGGMYGLMAEGDSGRVFSTGYWNTSQKALKKFREALQEFLIKYEQSAVVNTVVVQTLQPNVKNGSAGRSYIVASKVWKIISPRSDRNCAYKAVALCLNKHKQNDLLNNPLTLKNLSNDLKRRVKPKHTMYADEQDLQRIADYKKTEIVVYNNVYEKMEVYTPARNLNRERIEIKLEAHHYSAMIRWSDIDECPAEAVEVPSGVQDNELIKTKNILGPYDDKFVAWDLECSGNGTVDKVHKCYASGFAWNDGYQSFWGLDSVPRSLDFLYDNRERFNNHTFYAHNSGGYDMYFMFREGLLEDERFHITNCVEQEGKYIHVKVVVGDEDCVITFRDSLRLLPAGLEKLCKEFDVKHKKLTETVSHDKITIDNWHTFSELPRYLEYDCKGLFEVLQAFSLQVFESTAQDEFKGCEAYVRQLFECARGVEYKKTRPSELKLELDGFSPIMNEAFEYDGIQHTTFPNPFHKTVEEFHKLQENDRKKDAWCEEKGIALHRIPHHIKFRELPAYVSHLTGVDLNDVQFDTGGKIGINMTSCFTGASLSKKSFFAKHYKQIKYPVYSLNEETDAFIRDFYRGGRVEIFHLGKVPADKLWYYDFTSLYPWCGTKNLPYGKPLWVDSFDVNKHFGFVQVRVKSKPNMVHKKPLHGLLEDGKFLFRHFKDFTPMVLFSEELQVGIKSGLYEYEIKGGYTFQSAPWMKNFFEEAFDRKAQAKKAGNNALAQVWKIIINSGYGFWGLRVKDRDTVLIQKSEKGVIYPYMNEGKFLNYNEVGEYSIMRVLSDLPVKDFNVGVASAISSYARCRLWSLINDIESKGKSVYMCDTDSIITNIKINDHPDLMREYMWDGCGDELGSLKNEADDFIKDKDEIKRLKEEEGNMICFNECILGGCKFYTLRKNGIDKTICKCKGYKKSKGEELTFKDFEEMAGGGVKSQRQVQFLCPKMNHVSMTERFSMRTPQVLKKFKFDYNKGVVHDDGKITPIYA